MGLQLSVNGLRKHSSFLIFCLYLFLYVVFCSVLVQCYLVASHAVAVENANLLILLAGHVVQALVGLHIAYLSRTHTETTVINTVKT